MKKVIRNLSTEEGRRFWESAERIAAEANDWPASKRAGINDVSATDPMKDLQTSTDRFDELLDPGKAEGLRKQLAKRAAGLKPLPWIYMWAEPEFVGSMPARPELPCRPPEEIASTNSFSMGCMASDPHYFAKDYAVIINASCRASQQFVDDVRNQTRAVLKKLKRKARKAAKKK